MLVLLALSAGGAALGAALAAFGAAPAWAAMAMLALAVPASGIDLRCRLIPNRMVAAGSAIAMCGAAVLAPLTLTERALAALAAGALLGIPALVAPAGMGMGDAKLAAMLGAFLGAGVALALVAALVAGTAAGAWIALRRGLDAARRATLPFGPFLAAGAAIAVAAGAVPG